MRTAREIFENLVFEKTNVKPLKFSGGVYMEPEHRIAWKWWQQGFKYATAKELEKERSYS